MRALDGGDRGAVAVIVAVMAVALFGLGAIVTDVGMLYAERRELQGGADAASLSIAGECAAGTCTGSGSSATAKSYANSNAEDDSADITSICSNSSQLIDGTNVLSCDAPEGVPAGAQFVEVRTATRNPSAVDPSKVDPALSGLLGNTGVAVTADSVALWGGPGVLPSALPLTFSYCEWAILTNGGEDLLDWPTSIDVYSVSDLERKIVIFGESDDPEMHNCSEIAADADLPLEPTFDTPGGFGWLDGAKEGCTSSTPNPDGTYSTEDGNSSGDCESLLVSLYDKTWAGTPELVYLPVYSEVDSSGNYVMASSMAFVLTGFHFGSGCGKPSLCARASLVDNTRHDPGEMCNARNWDTNELMDNKNQNCITGFFVKAPPPTDAAVGGPSLGVTVVSLFS